MSAIENAVCRETTPFGECGEEADALVLKEPGVRFGATPMCSSHSIGALGGYTQTDVESWDEEQTDER